MDTAVVALLDASPVLELVDHVLDAVTLAVDTQLMRRFSVL